MNFIKGVSGGNPSMSRRAYSLRIDKFVRDIKASFRSLGLVRVSTLSMKLKPRAA